MTFTIGQLRIDFAAISFVYSRKALSSARLAYSSLLLSMHNMVPFIFFVELSKSRNIDFFSEKAENITVFQKPFDCLS